MQCNVPNNAYLCAVSVSVKPDEQRQTDRAARGEPSLLELSRNIVQTRAETSLLGYAECSRYSTKLIVTEEGEAKLAWAMPWRGNEGKASVSVKPDEQRLSLLRLCHGEGTKAKPAFSLSHMSRDKVCSDYAMARKRRMKIQHI